MGLVEGGPVVPCPDFGTDEYSSSPLSLFLYQSTGAFSCVPSCVMVHVEPSSSNSKPRWLTTRKI
jgi:hypothetical protein